MKKKRNKVVVVSIIMCLLMLVVPTGISESVDEIENIEKSSDTYGRCKFYTRGKITLEQVGQKYIALADNLYIWVETLTFKVEQNEQFRSVIIRTLPDETPHVYWGNVRVNITKGTFGGFFGILYLGKYIQPCIGRAFEIEIEEMY